MSTAPVETRVDRVAEQNDDGHTLGRVTIVHDYLNQRGGAEKVVLEMSNIWPGAPIYTSLYRPDSTFDEFRGRDIRTSFLDRLPVDRGFRNLFPIYPAAFRSLGELAGEVVRRQFERLGAHRAGRARRSACRLLPHARPLALPRRLPERRRSPLAPPGGDPAGGQRVPPARSSRRRSGGSLHRQQPRGPANDSQPRTASTPGCASARGHRSLHARGRAATGCSSISRLLPYKRVDLVVSAATRLGIGLDVVGDGPMLNELREIAGPDVTFHRLGLGCDGGRAHRRLPRGAAWPAKRTSGSSPSRRRPPGNPWWPTAAAGHWRPSRNT